MAVLQMQRISICALKKDRKAILEKFGFNYNPRAKMRKYKISDMQLLEIVKAVTNFNDAKMLAELSEDLGEAMVGINEDEIALLMAERGK